MSLYAIKKKTLEIEATDLNITFLFREFKHVIFRTSKSNECYIRIRYC